jgi:uncharacterized membrane protein YeaQ/YmgE (transglycosylase-associated protein family)
MTLKARTGALLGELTYPVAIMVQTTRGTAACAPGGSRTMGILLWILFGLIAGLLARLIVPGDDPGGGGIVGILITVVIGIVGAFIGGMIGTALGWGTVTSFDLRSIALAVLGAIVFLLLLRALSGGRRAIA